MELKLGSQYKLFGTAFNRKGEEKQPAESLKVK